MLRSKPGVKWRAQEWEAITGAVEISMTWWKVSSVTWEMSTMMPSRFISATTSRPNWLSPSSLAILRVGGVTDQIGLAVGECHVPDAAVVEVLQIGEIVLDGGAVFDAHRQREDALLEVGPDFGNRPGDGGSTAGLHLDLFDEVDELVTESAAAARFLEHGGDVDRHECGVEPAHLRADEIEMAAFGPDRDVFMFSFSR